MTDTELDINVDFGNIPFYEETWFWAIVAVILFSLLIWLIRGGKKRNDKTHCQDKSHCVVKSQPLNPIPVLSVEEEAGNSREQNE